MESPAVLLLSGGVESTTLLHQLAQGGESMQALFVDYGQRAAPEERLAAENQ
jgi:7-cyano-7-deazaguanine synthase in queuosine biosynthesis